MRILVTNDDGIGAEGMNVLRRIAEEVSSDVWVVAPEKNQSGASHSMTLHEPLRVRQTDERTFVLRGTPRRVWMYPNSRSPCAAWLRFMK